MLQMSSDKKKTSVLKSMRLDQAVRLAEQKLKEGFVEEAIMIYGDILEKFPKNKKGMLRVSNLFS